MKYISLFYTHSGAIKFSNRLKKENTKHKIQPSPRKLSSNCGISVEFDYEKDIKNLIVEDVESLYSIENNEYALVYKSE